MIEIYKKLPGTNCGKCGVATCMAFALKVKKAQANLSDCPFMTGENSTVLQRESGAASVSSYEQVSDKLEKEATGADFRETAEAIGGVYESGGGREAIRLVMKNEEYELRREGLFSNGSYCRDPWTKIIVYDYVRRKGSAPLTGELVALGHFPRTATHVKAFQASAEKKVAERFKNDLEGLRKRCYESGGVETEGVVRADYSCCFDLLPRVPLYLSFWREDEEFDAQCTLLFDRSTEAYIDIEYLAHLLERFAEELGGQ